MVQKKGIKRRGCGPPTRHKTTTTDAFRAHEPSRSDGGDGNANVIVIRLYPRSWDARDATDDDDITQTRWSQNDTAHDV